MSHRISGQNFTVSLDSTMIHVDTASLTISDNSATSQTGGIPDGWVDGDVSASGELSVNAQNFKLISKEARNAGSWRGMKPFDIQFYAKTADEEIKVEAFGCKIKISDLLDIDKKGGSAFLFKIPFDVTDPNFIKINGVSYLDSEEIRNISR